MVSAVSFRSSTPVSFEEKIKQPQTFTVKEDAAAASSIQAGKEKTSGGKKFLKFILVAAAIAGALALAAKSGKFVVPEGATGIWNTIKSGINTAGNFVIDTFNKLFPQVKETAKESKIPHKLSHMLEGNKTYKIKVNA